MKHTRNLSLVLIVCLLVSLLAPALGQEARADRRARLRGAAERGLPGVRYPNLCNRRTRDRRTGACRAVRRNWPKRRHPGGKPGLRHRVRPAPRRGLCPGKHAYGSRRARHDRGLRRLRCGTAGSGARRNDADLACDLRQNHGLRHGAHEHGSRRRVPGDQHADRGLQPDERRILRRKRGKQVSKPHGQPLFHLRFGCGYRVVRKHPPVSPGRQHPGYRRGAH